MVGLNALLRKHQQHSSELCRYVFNSLAPMQKIVFVYLFKQSLCDQQCLTTSNITSVLASTSARIMNKHIQTSLRSLRTKGFVVNKTIGNDLCWALNDSATGDWLNYFKTTYNSHQQEEPEQEFQLHIDPIGVARKA